MNITMALLAAEIESAAPNAYTGKPGSLAYESEAQVAAFLVRRGKTVYDARDPDDKEADLITVTERVEAELADRIRGARIDRDQGLHFPAQGAYDSSGVLIDPDTAPVGLLRGIALLCELQAGGTFLANVVRQGIKRAEAETVEVEFFEGVDGGSIATLHPDIWKTIAQAIPKAFL